MEHDRRFFSQENTTFKQAITAQKVEINQLTKQLTEATRQLNQIAIKVIESGGQKPFENSAMIKPTKE